MMSFWPFRADDNSAASFERLLGQLSDKISRAAAQTDSFRLKQRRRKVLWTIYATFVYFLIAAILVLVTGWETWNILEYSVVAGGPIFIYGVRTALDIYYGIRVTSSQDYLYELQSQRDAAIERLKKATKFNSTQQLLEKYGAAPKKRQSSPQRQERDQQSQKRGSKPTRGKQAPPQNTRTGIPPPATANIQPRQPPPQQQAHSHGPGGTPPQGSQYPPPPPQGFQQQSPPNADFAPNAFPDPKQPYPGRKTVWPHENHRWYDRLIDILLGEDEAQAKNRIVLLCQNCRLVNGQAPPGAQTIEDVGRWRCMGCHAWNGRDSEAKEIMHHFSQAEEKFNPPPSSSTPVSVMTDSSWHGIPSQENLPPQHEAASSEERLEQQRTVSEKQEDDTKHHAEHGKEDDDEEDEDEDEDDVDDEEGEEAEHAQQAPSPSKRPSTRSQQSLRA